MVFETQQVLLFFCFFFFPNKTQCVYVLSEARRKGKKKATLKNILTFSVVSSEDN